VVLSRPATPSTRVGGEGDKYIERYKRGIGDNDCATMLAGEEAIYCGEDGWNCGAINEILQMVCCGCLCLINGEGRRIRQTGHPNKNVQS
jgi:hypothetical protein